MINRADDPRTDDTIVYELLRTARGAQSAEVVGTATFRGGRSSVAGPEAITIAIEEQLTRAFVDRLKADERPRGYRRSGRGMVEMLVPGMAEHFIARMRGLWLSYPDGVVVTAREATGGQPTSIARTDVAPERSEAGASPTDPGVRRVTLAASDDRMNTRPLVRANAPVTGLRPEQSETVGPVKRTDCGWIV